MFGDYEETYYGDDEDERGYLISIEAEDAFVFYVKTDKTPEEIRDIIRSVPEEESWLDNTYIETERISDDYIEVWSGLTERIAFEAKFKDKDTNFQGIPYYTSTPGKPHGRKDIEYFEVEDVMEILNRIKDIYKDSISDIRLSSEYRGFTIDIKEDYGYFGEDELKKRLKAFKKSFLNLDSAEIYLENEQELLEAAKNKENELA